VYNPFADRSINCDFACHRARGSQGGIDYHAVVGSAVPSCGPGVVRVASTWGTNGAGGWTVEVDHGGGISSFYLHLSAFRVSKGQVVSEGQILGLSGGAAGAPGSGSSTGQHIHWHINDNGVVVDPEVFVAGHPSTTPPETPSNSEDDDMKVIRLNTTGNTYLVGAEYMHHLPDANYINSATAAFGSVITYDSVAFHCVTDALGIPWSTIATIGPGAGWSFQRGLFSYPW